MPRGAARGLELTVDQQNLQIIRQRLRDAGQGGLLRELNKALKAAAVDVKTAEQSAAIGLPSKGTAHTGLRASIAAATNIRVSSSKTRPGVLVYVQENKVVGRLGRKTNLPSWRHPVFGMREVWVRQTMSPGWWPRAAQPKLQSAKARAQAALDAVARKIAKG